nr:hypothetical protein [Lentilactobacillus hilgardii]
MKDNQAKYPQLRFKGFTDPWEQRKLTDISEKVTEKNSDNEFSETLTNSAEYGIISQRDFFDKDISNEKNLNTYYVVRDGDFVYNPRISNFAPVAQLSAIHWDVPALCHRFITFSERTTLMVCTWKNTFQVQSGIDSWNLTGTQVLVLIGLQLKTKTLSRCQFRYQTWKNKVRLRAFLRMWTTLSLLTSVS